jgi:hypothetical protein
VRAPARRACRLGGPAAPSSRARLRCDRRRKAGSGDQAGVGEERYPDARAPIDRDREGEGVARFSWAGKGARAGPAGSIRKENSAWSTGLVFGNKLRVTGSFRVCI